MSRTGFEPTIPVTKRPKTYALYRAAAGTGNLSTPLSINHEYSHYVITSKLPVNNGGKSKIVNTVLLPIKAQISFTALQ
jgi:hypothetical protein